MAGKVGVCPNCKSKVPIPRPAPRKEEEDFDDLEEVPPSTEEERIKPSPPPKKRSDRVQPTPASKPRRAEPDDDEVIEDVDVVEDEPPPRRGRKLDRARADEDEEEDRPPRRRRARDEEEEDEDEPPRRSRPRRKRRARAGSSGGMSPTLIGLGVAAALFLVTCVVAVLVPPLAILPVGVGWLVQLSGAIMFLVVAFQDDAMQGILCLLVPCYSLYYLITHFEEEKIPFFIQLAGVGMTMIGGLAGGMGAGMRP